MVRFGGKFNIADKDLGFMGSVRKLASRSPKMHYDNSLLDDLSLNMSADEGNRIVMKHKKRLMCRIEQNESRVSN